VLNPGMEKSYFTSLDTEGKIELAWNYGEQITAIELGNRFISLFLLDKFFVEIHVDKNNKELLDIELQDDPEVLAAYMHNLDISDLFDTHTY
jgi:hypothetical protein